MAAASAAPPARLFVIFHKDLHEYLYKDISGDVLSTWVKFLGVNTAITKSSPAALIPLIVQEAQLPWYNPFLQLNRFCETSAFYHVWRNQKVVLAPESPYLGFFHYDMELRPDLFELLKREVTAAEAAGEVLLFPQSSLVARPHIGQLFPLCEWDRIIRLYNIIFGTKETIWNVVDKEIPLYHSFVLHRRTFQDMMHFAELAIGPLFEMSGRALKHWPFQLERLHGIFLALHTRTGRIARWVPLSGCVIHRSDQRDPVWAGGAGKGV